MAETFGTILDKLSILHLKKVHLWRKLADGGGENRAHFLTLLAKVVAATELLEREADEHLKQLAKTGEGGMFDSVKLYNDERTKSDNHKSG